MTESDLYEPIRLDPSRIGYAGALAIRELQLGGAGGYCDLVLFPEVGRDSPHKIVLVEGKKDENDDAGAKVVGQVLKYYSHALQMSVEGLAALRSAVARINAANSQMKKNALSRVLGVEKAEAYALLMGGLQSMKLQPRDIGLLIVLDQFADEQARRLGHVVDALQKHHSLSIRVIVSDNQGVRDVAGGALGRGIAAKP